MINIIKQAGTIALRYERDDKPQGTEYLYADGHNEKKCHHIIITEDGELFYNQAISYAEIVRDGEVVQAAGYQDFYEWALVGCMESHGYREYLDAAMIEKNAVVAQQRRDLLEAGDLIAYWNNQAFREAECLAVIGTEALVCFTMPSGDEFLHVVKAQGRKIKTHSPCTNKFQFVRNMSWNKIPLKWKRAAGI